VRKLKTGKQLLALRKRRAKDKARKATVAKKRKEEMGVNKKKMPPKPPAITLHKGERRLVCRETGKVLPLERRCCCVTTGDGVFH
jgi:hypothetical protein